MVTSKTTEHLEPFLGGPIVSALSYALGWHLPPETSTQVALLGSSMTAGSIVFGFLSTAMVLLLGFEGSRMRQLEQSGYLKDLVTYLREAIYIVTGFTLISLIGFFLEAEQPIYMALWVGFGAASLIAFRRIFVLLMWLMKKPN